MIEREEWTAWIDASDQLQVTWACNYLHETVGVGLPPRVYTEHNLGLEMLRLAATAIQARPELQADKSRLQRMKAAWRKEKQRIKARKEGKKSVTVVISAKAKRQLDALVPHSEFRASPSKVVEQLILGEAVALKGRSKREKMDRQRSRVGKINSHRLDDSAPAPMKAIHHQATPVMSAGRYTDAELAADRPGKTELIGLHSGLAEAREVISQLKTELHEANAVLAKITALGAGTADRTPLDSAGGPSSTTHRSESSNEGGESHSSAEEQPDAGRQDEDQIVAATSGSGVSDESVEQNSGEHTQSGPSQQEGFHIGEKYHPPVRKDAEVTIETGIIKGERRFTSID